MFQNSNQVKFSPPQEVFYFEWLLNPGSSRFHIVFDQFLYGELDPDKLTAALKRYVADHFILNCHAQLIQEESYWVQNEHIQLLEYIDHPVSDIELFEKVSRSFNLCEEPLYRFILNRVDSKRYRLILVFHHILLDASDFDHGVCEQISTYYNDPDYRINISPEQQAVLSDKLNRHLWSLLENNKVQHATLCEKLFSDVDPVDLRFLQLPTQAEIANVGMNPIGIIRFSFPEEDINRLIQICRDYGITPYLYGCCIFAALIHRHTNQDHLAIGYSISVDDSLDFVHGAQVNGFLFPFHFQPEECITDVFERARTFIQSVKQSDVNYAHLPIPNLVKEDRRQLLDVSFVQTNFRETKFTFDGIERVEITHEFDQDLGAILSFEQEINERKLNYRVKYDKSQINPELLENFVDCYQRVFIEILNDLASGKKRELVVSYSLLDARQYQQLIIQWNQTKHPYPENKTIADLFEDQVKKTPDQIALVFEKKQFTYRQLNDRANQLARHLQTRYAIQADDLITLCLSRNEHMLISILAVLKAGAAYVPIDPSYPDSRIAYMLQDTQSKVLLTNEIHQVRLRKLSSELISVDSESTGIKVTGYASINPSRATNSHHLAYVIYTSGTTGQPKGVMLENASVINTIYSLNHVYDLKFGRKITAFTSYAFDVSVSEFFTALLRGGELHLLSEALRNDPEAIGAYLINNEIDYAFLAPVTLSYLAKTRYPTLKCMIYAGEPCDKKTGQYWSQQLKLYNYYGPTETAIYAVGKQVVDGDIHLIGRPINNGSAFVLNSDLSPLPVGAVGELYIGGFGVARGYLNKPELTSERFPGNPFSTGKESRLYKTGDLARWLPDGNLEYLGRTDTQVKVRGFRIELSEIEFHLSSYPGIKQVVADVQYFDNSNQPYLVGYYVSNERLEENDIFFYLKEHLPDYMVPVFLIPVDFIPLTANGKTDKQALPKPNKYARLSSVAPVTALEHHLASIWSAVLEVAIEHIGTTDSFFKLGGNSLSIVRLKNQLSQIAVFQSLTLADLFKYPTIGQLARKLESHSSIELINVTQKSAAPDTVIAIVGMSGAFSGGSNLNDYWRCIESGKEGISHYELSECHRIGTSESLLQNPMFVPSSGHIPELDQFDAAFWGMTPNEAKKLDPQVRLFLEHCWFALEDSGYVDVRQKINVGVFAAAGEQRYRPDLATLPLSSKDALATQVSYFLGLTGPAYNISTACSSSLITVIEACKNLVGGYCDMAIAGGVSLLLPEETGYVYQHGMILAQDGHCRAFDAQTSGTVPGSGVGAVVLKRLCDAQRDGDQIIGLIKGYASNNDGNRKISYNAPSVIGQMECIVAAQKMAGISSDMIDYVECHGTGTKLGDPIEVQALAEAFDYTAKHPRSKPCILGSVKSNIGHADTAAGIAGLLKVCAMLKNERIPPQINYSQANPEFHLLDAKFNIQTEAQPWSKSTEKLRIAAVSSFGMGGTNAHVIVSDCPHTHQVARPNVVKGARHCFNRQSYWLNSNRNDNLNKLSLLSKNEWVSVPVWKKLERFSDFDQKLFYHNIFLIFKNRHDARFDELNTLNNQVIYVDIDNTLKEEFLFSNDGNLLIRSASDTACHKIFSYLEKNRIRPDIVIHAVTLQDSHQREIQIDDELEKGFYSLVFIESHILAKLSAPLKFIVLTQGIAQITGTDPINICNGAMVGALRTIKHELPGVKSSIIDISDTPLVLNHLLAFIYDDAHYVEENLYAMKFQSLWVESLEILANSFRPHHDLIKDGDIILVTGGLGGIGLALSSYIAQKHKVTFILTSRQNVLKAKEKQAYMQPQLSLLDKIKSHGSSIEIRCADIANAAEVESLINEIYNQHHRLSGIIHAAGLAPLAINERSFENVKLAIRAKIHGSAYLMNAIRDRHVNFYTMISSLASIIGDVNRIEYCAANSCLDYLSNSNEFPKNCKVQTFNWPGWSEVGMAAKQFASDASSSYPLILNLEKNAVRPEEGAELFYDLVQKTNHSQLVISKLGIPLLKKTLFRKNKNNVSDPSKNIRNQIIEKNLPGDCYSIAQLFVNVLGIEKISIDDDFFSLGGNSLAAIELISDLEKIGVHLKLSDINTLSTIRKIFQWKSNRRMHDDIGKIIVPLAIHNEQNRNVFFIHPVGGTVMFYLDIVKHLTDKYNYYGIQNINISGPQIIKAETFEALSQIYLNEILKIQPEGEYILMGSSMGGTIAFEIASQLIALGKKVKFVAMFDSWAHYSEHFYDKNIVKNQTEQYKHIFSVFEQTDALIEASWELMKLLLNYRPGKTSLDIHLYKAEELDEDYKQNGICHDNGWQSHSTLALKIYSIPGTHTTIHRAPGRTKIISLLNRSLM